MISITIPAIETYSTCRKKLEFSAEFHILPSRYSVNVCENVRRMYVTSLQNACETFVECFPQKVNIHVRLSEKAETV